MGCFRADPVAGVLLFAVAIPRVCEAQTATVLEGRIVDALGSAVPGVSVSVREKATGVSTSIHSDGDGRYHVEVVPGIYTVTVDAPGFRSELVEDLTLDVGRTIVRNFRLTIGSAGETVVVRGVVPLVDRATATVGHVV